jgi:predicted  nucleic acid-binding Zn-ribbon protein
MRRAGRLFELQEQDLAIDRIDSQLAAIAGRLGETPELIAAREALRHAEARVAELERRRKEVDRQVQDTRAKREREETKLYSGTLVSPKEMHNLQQEVDSLRRRALELQDRELAIMAELEEAEAARSEAQRAVAELEAHWQDDQAALLREREALTAERARAVALREQRLRLVDPDDLPRYHELRRRLAGRAVARVERGICAACRVSLPEREIQKARTSPTLVTCSNCGRILYAG